MRKKLLAAVFLITGILNVYSVKFNDLSDDTLIMKVGSYPVTMLDLKLFMSGYNSIQVWNSDLINQMLDKISANLLYMNAAQDEKLAVSNVELDYYGKKFFSERSINTADQKAVKLYFDQNDPYYSMDDFILKSTMYLTKIKYLAHKGYLQESRAYVIFLSSKQKNLAESLVRQLAEGKIDFFTALNKYAENRKEFTQAGEVISKDSPIAKKVLPDDLKRILKAGLFSPVFVSGEKGYYIIMNIDYIIQEDQDTILKVLQEIAKKYGINRLVSFNG